MQRVKIVKPGYEVLTETDPKNYIFDSEIDSPKTVLSDSVQETVSASSTNSQTIAHGQSAEPIVLVYFRDTSGGEWRIATPSANRHFGSFTVSVYVDDTNIYLDFINGTVSQITIEAQYELLI